MDFCADCAPVAQDLTTRLRERDEALAKSDRVRSQLRTAAETLQRRLALTQKQLNECHHASSPSDSSTRRPSHGPSSNGTSDSSSEVARQSDAEGRELGRELTALQSEVTQRRRRSEVDAKELSALQEEVTEREAESDRLLREIEEWKRKLSQSEALAQDRLRDLETVKKTWVSRGVHEQVAEELAELKAKEDARATNPLDALNALQRDLEGAASFRKTSMGDAHKRAQLTLQVAELNDTLTRVTQENAQYRIAVTNLEEEASGLRQACMHSTSSVVQRYDDLRSELKILRAERQEMYARMGVLEDENKTLRVINDEGKVQRMESELRNLSVEIERLRSCNTALCSQLFGDSAGKACGDLDVNMLLQGQRPMDAAEDEFGEDTHIKTIVRLQHKLTEAEEKHLTEKEQLMEKVRQMERNYAARMAPQALQQEAPKETSTPSSISSVGRITSLMPTGMPSLSGWSSLVSK